ncbi:MAG: type 2 isopentenyl-diphosphate Delta-isomerase [Candidatus Diapherotrites archaeon]|nr:type 2 isopentenyl-diphosphate Delta-isomerase [Candidatus Diapherotrites archaeon]
MPTNFLQTKKRKGEHLKIVLNKKVAFKEKTTGLEDVSFKEIELLYTAIPRVDKKKIDLRTAFFSKKFSAPLMVSGMTGGVAEAKKINKDIAKACEELGLGMGVGSQRAMIENPLLTETYFVRDVAPKIFIAGNIGAAQLEEYSCKQIQKAIDDIGADALAIHLNAAQEAVQKEGDTNFSNTYSLVKKTVKEIKKPVYVKEVGNGITFEVAKLLAKTGIKAIDVQGAGGTTWVGVESFRGNKDLGETFWDIGIPTTVSVMETRKAFNGPIIASGGIRTGLDVVKCIILGADLASMAYPVLKAQNKGGASGVKNFLEKIIEEARTAMFLVGAKNIKELKKKKFVLKGKTLEWAKQRKLV